MEIKHISGLNSPPSEICSVLLAAERQHFLLCLLVFARFSRRIPSSDQSPWRHEEIIEELKLQDTKLVDRDFVRIEITPNNKEKLTRNQQDWTFKVDEETTIPAWYNESKKLIEELIWQSWSESIKTQREGLEAKKAEQEAERTKINAEKAQAEAKKIKEKAENAQAEADRAEREADRAEKIKEKAERIKEEAEIEASIEEAEVNTPTNTDKNSRNKN